MFAGYTVAVIKIEYLYGESPFGTVRRTIDGLCFDVEEANDLIKKLESFEDVWVQREIVNI